MNTSWLLVSILLYCLVLVNVLLYAFRVRHAKFSDPIVQFVFFLTLFTLPLPIRSYFSMYPTGDITEHLPELIPFMPVALLLCSLSLIVFVWGYYSRFADRTAEHLWRPRTGDRYYLA